MSLRDSDRGPVPTLSATFQRLFPEVTVLGGAAHFAHDRGMMNGPPEWFVGGQPVDTRDSNIVNAICQHRKITADAAQVAQVAFEHYVHKPDLYQVPIWTEPECWAKSAALAQFEFAPPSFVLEPDPDFPETQVSTVTFWHRREEQTENPEFVYCRYQRREIPNENRLPDDQIEHWVTWSKHRISLRAAPHQSGTHYSQKIGAIVNGQDIETIQTTPDGLQPFQSSKK